MASLYDTSVELLRKLYYFRFYSPPILECSKHFPDAPLFVEKWETIRREAFSIIEKIHEVPRFHELIQQYEDVFDNDGEDWRFFVLKAYGADNQENMKKCPVISSLVQSCPDVLSAGFSYMSPGKYIPRHRGPFRGVIRFHLGLTVPKAADGSPGAGLLIDDEKYIIKEGEPLLWDETYPHEAWNHSDDYRIVLLMDIRRKNMPFDMELLSRLIIGAMKFMVRKKLGIFSKKEIVG